MDVAILFGQQMILCLLSSSWWSCNANASGLSLHSITTARLHTDHKKELHVFKMEFRD